MGVITYSIVTTIILAIVFILIGIWFKKLVISSEDFMLAGRKAPFWLLASAYLGGFVGGSSVAGYVSLGYTDGISGMWTALFVVAGCVVFIVAFARRVNYFGRKTGAITIADFVCTRYGESLRLPISIIGFLRPGVITGMQFLAIAIVANVMFGLNLKIGVFAGAGIMLLYLVTAGQYSALVNQWLQSLLQSVGIFLIALIAFRFMGSPSEMIGSMFDVLEPALVNIWSVDVTQFSVWMITFGLFYLVDPWIYMWAYMAESPKTSSNGMLSVLGGSYFNVLPFVSGMAILGAALIGRFTVPAGLSGDALYAWFTINHAGTVVGVLILTGLIMTIVSCGSSFAMNGVTLLTNDIFHKVIAKKASDSQVLLASRISLGIVVIIGIACANWLPILVPLWSLGQAIVISGLFAPTMSAWFWRRSTTAGALSSALAGGIGSFLWACYAWINVGSPGGLMHGMHACHIGLALSIPIMIIVSLATKPDYSRADLTSYRVLGEELKTSDLVVDKVTRPGLFGWLGADTSLWKFFWVCVFTVFILHFILSFWFHVPTMALLMIWVSLIVSVAMILLLGGLGARDAVRMLKGE